MEPEKRRRFVRKRTDQLLYAELGPDNGSILLNLCEEGCSFQSIAPVRDEQVHFSVSVGDGRKLEGEGQIVWSDAAKKTGGLLFLNSFAGVAGAGSRVARRDACDGGWQARSCGGGVACEASP